MTVLSQQPDGMGFYYGFVDGCNEQINVRKEDGCWVAYVGGKPIGSVSTKLWAEAVAIDYVMKVKTAREADE